ncbi:MAG: hypothetical protein ACXV9R_13010 [Methylobacter sp.]
MKQLLSVFMFFGLLLCIPFSIGAKTIDLICTDGINYPLDFHIDTSSNIVVFGRKFARNVFIDKDNINFGLDMNDGEWHHFISRKTGYLTIQSPENILLPSAMLPTAKCREK